MNAEVIPVRRELQGALSWALTLGVEQGEYAKFDQEWREKIPKEKVRRIRLTNAVHVLQLAIMLSPSGWRKASFFGICRSPAMPNPVRPLTCKMIYCGLATSPQQCTGGGNEVKDKIGDNIEEAWRFIAFAFFASLIPTSAVVVQVKVATASFFVVDDGIASVVVCAKVPPYT